MVLAATHSAPAETAFDPSAGLPLIRSFPPEVYRAHSQIFATAQTPDGTMYFATYGTVVSFDGERWRQYPVPGTWVRALTVGPDGLLYVGGVSVLGRLEPAPDTGLLQFVSLAAALPAEHRSFGTVWSSAALDGGVGFAIDGAVLGWRDGKFRAWEFPKTRPALRSAGGEAFCHLGDRVLHWREGAWEPWLSDARLAEARRVVLAPAGPGAFLLVLDTGAIFRAALAETTLAAWPTAAAAFLRDAGIRNALQLPDGTYAISTAGEGVVFLAPDGTPLRHLTAATGLANATTYGLACARDSTLWVETANGVSQVDLQNRWTIFDARNGRPEGIGGEPTLFDGGIVMSVSDAPLTRLQPAADGLGLARLAPMSDQLPARLSSFQAVGGHLYSGGERGLMRIDGTPALVHASPSQIENICAVSACPGVMAIGMLRGIELVRLNAGDTATPLGTVAGLDSEITFVTELPHRTLWAGTTVGAAIRVRLNADGSIADTTRFDAARGLPPGAGWVNLAVTGGQLLVIVRDGVFQLSPDGEKLVPHPAFADHHPAGINTLPIATDGAGRFWFQVARSEGRYETGCLDLRGAAPGWTPLDPAIDDVLGFGGARAITYVPEKRDAFLWVSGTRAIVRLDPAAPPPAMPPPRSVIAEISQGALHWAPRADAPRLAFEREPLHFHFAAPQTPGDRISYETRLLGYDANWAPASGPEATFTNLVGGPFTFEVRALDALNRAGDAARYTFSVAPPWHRTPLAYAVYALLALAGVASFVRWRLAHATREQRRLEGIVAERTRDLAAARDQAEAANRAKSSFLAAMSHELRTPLNGVIGYTQVLQADPRLAPDQQERLRIVQASGDHLLHMINDVLDLAKIEAGKVTLRPAPSALGDLLRDIAAAHAPAAAAKGLDFQLELAPDLPAWVECDAQKLRQVLDNLLGNAVKFTAAGSITLNVALNFSDAPPSTLSSQLIRFSVTDTGPGISLGDRARLFQAFEQAHDTRPDAPGAGLGLALSRALVGRLGGTLALSSTLGKGSTFSFALALPPIAPPAPAGPGRRLAGYEGEPRRVLIVDDHDINRRLLVDLLTPLGFMCVEFSAPHLALAQLTDGDEPWPDLAIVDIRMAGLDGLAFTRRLRQLPRGPQLKVLLTSASVLSFDLAEGRRAGGDDFIAKPFHAGNFLEKIRALLDLRWRDADSAPPFAPAAPPQPSAPLPEAAREALREHLASGDLGAFRRELTAARAAHPAAEARWRELEEAAAVYQLARLRQLLEIA